MTPTDLAELRQALEPRATSAADVVAIARVLHHHEASLRKAEADRRMWERPVWRLWPTVCNLLCAPWRLVVAWRMPPDQC
jgi:hypothetical protein